MWLTEGHLPYDVGGSPRRKTSRLASAMGTKSDKDALLQFLRTDPDCRVERHPLPFPRCPPYDDLRFPGTRSSANQAEIDFQQAWYIKQIGW